MHHIRLVVFASLLHDSSSVMNSRQELFESIRKFAELEVIYPSTLASQSAKRGPRRFYEGADSNTSDRSEELLTQDPETRTLCFIATGGTEEMFRTFIDVLPKPVTVLSDGFHNSFAASFEICSWLGAKGIENTLINVPLDCNPEFFKGLEEKLFGEKAGFAQTDGCIKLSDAPVFDYPKNTLHLLSKSRIGLIGGASSWLIASDVDIPAVEKKYGAKFLNIGIKELEEAYMATDTSDAAVNSTVVRMERFLTADRTREQLADAARMYVALKTICTKYELTALTLKCFDILDSCKTTACLALGLLNDEGVICGCEGDIPTLWSMLVIHLTWGKPAFMSNPSSSNSRENTVDFAHCTIPMKMLHGYRLPSHFESSIGIGIQGSLPCGRYGILKFYGKELDRAYRAEGDIIMNTNIPQRCRTQIRFKFADAAEYARFIAHRTANHVAIYSLD
jgi:hypothetical protein